MSGFKVPNDRQEAVIRGNGIQLNAVVVMHDSGDTLVLQNCATRDTIMIMRGDKEWKQNGN